MRAGQLSTGFRLRWRDGAGRLTLEGVKDRHSVTWRSQLQAQSGVVSWQQARDAGFSAKAIDWRLRSGTWQRLYLGVYATFTGIPTRAARLWAAVTARRQARRRDGSGIRYLDNLYEEYGLCVELDGAAAHPPEGRWRDTRRDNATLVQGAQTLRYGWPDTTEYRCRTAAEIAMALRRHGWTGTLRPCGPTCTAARPARKIV